MSMRRYKYNQKAGALQEAMGATVAAAMPQPQSLSSDSTMTIDPFTGRLAMHNAPARAQGAAAADDNGVDQQQFARAGYGGFFYTVEDGQRVMVIEKDGTMSVVEGPRRIWRGSRRFRAMSHYIAHPGEFLVIRYRDGRQEHLAGPAHCWLDPREHRDITKEEALQISAKEAVVAYNESSDNVTRQIIHGPATFVPQPGQWLHTFSWHGSVGGAKVPNALVFQKLWMMPDQMYHDVTQVRTADDAVLTLKLMIFFELVDIERMLAATHDPIGDFVNAATSDVVEFLSRLDFEQFKHNTDKLNDLSTYRQLVSRANQCGYRIDRVVYRGYGAPPALQQMHDQAIESRTRLQLERATEQQAQELADFKLDRKLNRSSKERSEREAEFTQELALKEREEEARLALDARRADAARQQARQDQLQAAELAASDEARQRAHLEALSKLGVDLTALLTQGRADQVIEVRGNGQNHLHLKQ